MPDTTGYVDVGYLHGAPVTVPGSRTLEHVGFMLENGNVGGYDWTDTVSGPSGIQSDLPAPMRDSQGGDGIPALPDPFVYAGGASLAQVVQLGRSSSGGARWMDEALDGDWALRHSFGPNKLHDPYEGLYIPCLLYTSRCV